MRVSLNFNLPGDASAFDAAIAGIGLRNGAPPARETVQLTAAEREAVEYFAQWGRWEAAKVHADTMRGLLVRLGGEQ